MTDIETSLTRAAQLLRANTKNPKLLLFPALGGSIGAAIAAIEEAESRLKSLEHRVAALEGR